MHKTKYMCLQNMPQKSITQSFSLMSTFDQAWDIYEGKIIMLMMHDSQIGHQGSEMISSDLCLGIAHSIDQS